MESLHVLTDQRLTLEVHKVKAVSNMDATMQVEAYPDVLNSNFTE